MTRAAPAFAQRWLARWHRAECALAVAAFATVALLLVADVVARDLLVPLARTLGLPTTALAVPAGPKLALFALSIGVWAGLGIASATGTHLVPRVGHGWVPPRALPGVERAGDLASAAVWIVAAGYAALYVHGSWSAGLRAPMLGWPLWPLQLAMPAGFASAGLRHLAFATWPALRPRRDEAAT